MSAARAPSLFPVRALATDTDLVTLAPAAPLGPPPGNRQRRDMRIGGQVGDYVEEPLVSLAMAVRAARQYVEDGTRASELTWTPS